MTPRTPQHRFVPKATYRYADNPAPFQPCAHCGKARISPVHPITRRPR